jgi:hypothetical protein
MDYLEVKNWNKYQKKVKAEHRKEFMALHFSTLDDPEFLSLTPAKQLLLLKCWMLRGRLGHNLPCSLGFLDSKLGRFDGDDMDDLIAQGWLVRTADKHPPKIKTKKAWDYNQEYSEDFKKWWKEYPRKQFKGDAWKAWGQVLDVLPPEDKLLAATKQYAKDVKYTEKKYIKLPAGWLRSRRWEELDVEPKKEGRMVVVNRILDREQVTNYCHPMWKHYVSAVVAGEVEPGFEDYIAGQ